jgi:hypothetical protein
MLHDVRRRRMTRRVAERPDVLEQLAHDLATNYGNIARLKVLQGNMSAAVLAVEVVERNAARRRDRPPESRRERIGTAWSACLWDGSHRPRTCVVERGAGTVSAVGAIFGGSRRRPGFSTGSEPPPANAGRG